MIEILICHLCGTKFTEANGGGKFKEFHYTKETVLCPKCTSELLELFGDWKETFAAILRNDPQQKALEAEAR